MIASAIQRNCFAAVLLFQLPIWFGCTGQSSPPTARQPQTPPGSETDPARPAPAASGQPPVSPARQHPAVPELGSTAASRPTGRQLTPKETLEVLLGSRFSAIGPTEAKQKLSSVSEVRETSLSTTAGVNIYAETSTPRFFVGYVQDSVGAWAFVNAKATAVAADDKAADALYQDYEKALRKRYGKTAWVNDNSPPPPIKGWSIEGGTLEVSLTMRANEVGETVVEVDLFEPQGEPE